MLSLISSFLTQKFGLDSKLVTLNLVTVDSSDAILKEKELSVSAFNDFLKDIKQKE